MAIVSEVTQKGTDVVASIDLTCEAGSDRRHDVLGGHPARDTGRRVQDRAVAGANSGGVEFSYAGDASTFTCYIA